MSVQAMNWAEGRSRGMAQLVLTWLANYADPHGCTIVGQDRLAKACGINRGTVVRALKRLEADEMIARYRRDLGGGTRTSDLTVLAPSGDRGGMKPAKESSVLRRSTKAPGAVSKAITQCGGEQHGVTATQGCSVQHRDGGPNVALKQTQCCSLQQEPLEEPTTTPESSLMRVGARANHEADVVDLDQARRSQPEPVVDEWADAPIDEAAAQVLIDQAMAVEQVA